MTVSQQVGRYPCLRAGLLARLGGQTVRRVAGASALMRDRAVDCSERSARASARLAGVICREMEGCAWAISRARIVACQKHDDLLISAALTARLDRVDWRERVARGSG